MHVPDPIVHMYSIVILTVPLLYSHLYIHTQIYPQWSAGLNIPIQQWMGVCVPIDRTIRPRLVISHIQAAQVPTESRAVQAIGERRPQGVQRN